MHSVRSAHPVRAIGKELSRSNLSVHNFGSVTSIEE